MDHPTLLLLRHGKSDWSGPEPDHDRPLKPRGRRQAAEAGRWLAEHAGPIDLAVVSTAVRAQSTWELAAGELGAPPEVRLDEDVYGASVAELLDVVRGLPARAGTVVLVGHNPGLEELAEVLTGGWTPMPTAALVVVTLNGPWSHAGDGRAALRAAGRPPRP